MPSGRRQVGGCGRGLGGPVLSEPQSPRLLAERWAWVAGMMGNQLHGGVGGGWCWDSGGLGAPQEALVCSCPSGDAGPLRKAEEKGAL